MATNISVTLVIDNQTYIANLNKAKNATKDFANEAKTAADAVGGSFNKVTTSTSMLAGNIHKLKGALAGAAFAGFAKSAIQFADSVQELANVVGIATPAIINFQKAVGTAGGDFEKGSRGLLELYQNIDEARNGSISAQAAFASLGISLNDLANLDEQQILNKTLENLSQMDASGAKVRLQTELMGKAMKGVSIDPQFIETLKQGDEKSQKMAASIERAAQLNDQFNESWINLKVAFLEAFNPIITGLSNIITAVEKLNEKLPILTTLFKALAVAVVAFMVASGFREVIGMVSMVARGLQGIYRLLMGIKNIRIGNILGSTASGVKKTKDALTAQQNTKAAQALRNNATAAGAVVGTGIGVAVVMSGDNTPSPTKKSGTTPPGKSEVKDALAAYRAGLDDVVDGYKNVNAKQLETLKLDNSLIGLSKTDSTIKKAMLDLDLKERDAIDKLKSQREKLTPEQQKLGAAKDIDDRIAKIKEITAADKKALEEEMRNNALREISNATLAASRQRLYAVQQQVSDMKFDTATMGMSQLEKNINGIVKGSEDWKNSTVQALASAENISVETFKQLYPEKVLEVYKAATQGLNDLTDAAKANFAEAQRINDLNYKIQERIGYERELQKIYDEQAKLGLGTLESKYYDIDAAARASAQAQIDAIDKVMFSADQLAQGMSIRTTDPERVRQIVADATQGTEKLKQQTKNLYDASRQFSTGWGRAFRKYTEDATDAAQTAERVFARATQGMEDAIVNFAKTGKFEWKGFVSSIVEELLRAQVRQLISNTFGGISSGFMPGESGGMPTNKGLLGLGGLFGFLANGGAAQANRPYIVGERGPELFVPSGSGTVIPNNQLGSASMTNVVYNISAVDATSFKQLVARDPSFIHAVALQGAKSMAGGRR